MSKPPVKNALVVGAGFSGMAAAIGLCRLGVAVDLVEMDPGWQPAAGAIHIGSGALQAFEALGILDAYLATVYRCEGIDVMAADGALVAHYPDHAMAPGARGAAVPRAVMARLLADATLAAGAEVRLGITVKSLRQGPDGVDVEFTDTHGARYDLLVAADGVRSRLRELVLRGAPQPAFSGQAVWCAQLPRPEQLLRTTVWQGHDLEVELHPVSPDAVHLSVHQSGASREVPKEHVVPLLRALLGRFPASAVRALEESLSQRSQAVYRALVRVDLAQPWHSGRAVLVGDAVHGTLARHTSDGSRGMEDAVLLALELKGAASIEDALAGFQQRRWNPRRSK